MTRKSLLPALVAAAALAAVIVLAAWGFSAATAAAVGLAGVAGVWLATGIGAPALPPPPVDTAATVPPKAETPSQAAAEYDKGHPLAGELAAAREIQMRLVPHTFPPLPGCPPFDLFALIEPAREIGGDFYDFWMLGRERIALVMADVSGKGLPAALYMAMTRTYLRAFSRSIHDPAKLLERLNREVARHNPGCMFVTVFCAMINLETGEMEYANAGHNPPLRKKRGQAPEYFDFGLNPPVGFLEHLEFQKTRVQLDPGEMLLLYTDGVTEAMDEGGAMFGTDSVQSAFASATDASDACRAVTMQMRCEVADFVGDAEQYDDITIMTYRQPDQDDWLQGGGYAGEDLDTGDSAMMSIGGESSPSITGSLATSAGNEKFYSLSDLK